MARFRTIQYMVDPVMSMVYSRVGDELAIPVLDFEGMKPSNNYQIFYNLEKFKALEVAGTIGHVIRTRKIPLEIKNYHRKFWGMKPIKG